MHVQFVLDGTSEEYKKVHDENQKRLAGYKEKNTPTKDTYFLSGFLNSEKVGEVTSFLERKKEEGIKAKVLLDSDGGMADAAISLSNAINRTGAQLIGTGMVGSAALRAFILTNRNQRSMEPGTRGFMHKPILLEARRLHANDLRQTADNLDKIATTVIKEITDNTDTPQEEAEKMVSKDTYLEYDEMKNFGFFDPGSVDDNAGQVQEGMSKKPSSLNKSKLDQLKSEFSLIGGKI